MMMNRIIEFNNLGTVFLKKNKNCNDAMIMFQGAITIMKLECSSNRKHDDESSYDDILEIQQANELLQHYYLKQEEQRQRQRHHQSGTMFNTSTTTTNNNEHDERRRNKPSSSTTTANHNNDFEDNDDDDIESEIIMSDDDDDDDDAPITTTTNTTTTNKEGMSSSSLLTDDDSNIASFMYKEPIELPESMYDDYDDDDYDDDDDGDDNHLHTYKTQTAAIILYNTGLTHHLWLSQSTTVSLQKAMSLYGMVYDLLPEIMEQQQQYDNNCHDNKDGTTMITLINRLVMATLNNMAYVCYNGYCDTKQTKFYLEQLHTFILTKSNNNNNNNNNNIGATATITTSNNKEEQEWFFVNAYIYMKEMTCASAA